MTAPKAPLFFAGGEERPTALQPPGWPMPKGYANGMMADGRILVTGGVVGWDVTGNFPDGFVAQARQTLSNIRAILAQGGAEPHHLVRLTWYVLDIDEYKAEQSKSVNLLLGLVYALLGLAILIALLGIANTLALSVLERTRELGMMRAVGMSRAQLRSSVRWESVIIALQGTLIGLGIGVVFGWALVVALRDEGIDRLAIPWTTLAIVVVLAAVAGVLAAVFPAHRAAKLDILRAIGAE